jgi:UDP-3-O-[3-hydroxymyristoyl] glucosamine N-acyltransferase
VISKGVCLGLGAVISAGAFIGEDSILGNNCYIFANVTIRERIRIGNNVVIYPNAVIGSDGFGYAWDGSRQVKIPQIGTVVIEDDVEIGAGTIIDRATLGETVIGRGTIIDNLVQIGHNCKIGAYSVLCAQVGLAGSTTLGEHVTLAGQVGVAGHLQIGDGAIVEAQSGVAGDIPKGMVHFGYPSREVKVAHRIEAIINHLPEYVTRLRKLEAFFKQQGQSMGGTKSS